MDYSILFVGSLLGGGLMFIGLKETFNLFGSLDDPQFGEKFTRDLLHGLTIAVWGITIILLTFGVQMFFLISN